MFKIEDKVTEVKNMGPTPVYFGREVGDHIEHLFTLQPGEARKLVEKRVIAESRDGSGVIRLFEERCD